MQYKYFTVVTCSTFLLFTRFLRLIQEKFPDVTISPGWMVYYISYLLTVYVGKTGNIEIRVLLNPVSGQFTDGVFCFLQVLHLPPLFTKTYTRQMMGDMYDMIKDVPQKVKDIEVGLWVQGCTHA